MLHLAVCAGLRVSELTGLRIDDVAPQSASIRVRGKGRRERALPLWKTTATALRAWLAVRGSVASPELFVNARGQPLSRWGVAYVLRRHTETANRKCSTLHGKQVSPHVLRHYPEFRTIPSRLAHSCSEPFTSRAWSSDPYRDQLGIVLVDLKVLGCNRLVWTAYPWSCSCCAWAFKRAAKRPPVSVSSVLGSVRSLKK